MSYFDRIGGKFSPVPAAPNARNQQLHNQNSLTGVIKSAVWGQTQAAPGQVVPFTITLNRPAIAKNVVVEMLFNRPHLSPQVIGGPMILPSASVVIQSRWTCINKSGGYFTFRVRVDNQSMISNQLTLVDDPVSRVVRRNSSDGFDR